MFLQSGPLHLIIKGWATELTLEKVFEMKSKTLRVLTIFQLAVLLLFLALTLCNEIIDVPHYVFGDKSTSYSQRLGEIGIELFIFILVMAIQILLIRMLYQRIRILEGFIPICANCKKIRNTENQWEQMEKYITQNSLVQFSHGICPDCAMKLYPDLYKNKT
jgi:hypothetical protein